MKTVNISVLEVLLASLGLSEKETQIYKELLHLGEATAAQIMRATGLKRGITYAVLYKLEQIGLAIQYSRANKTWFQITSPQNLEAIAENKKKEIDAMEHNLQYMLPELISQYKLAVSKPTVRYFEGEQGIQEVFEDIYAPKKDVVYGCVDLEKTDGIFPAYITEKLIPKRIKNKITAFSLIADSQQARQVHEKDVEQLRVSRLLDKDKYPLPAEIDVYEDKIAMLSFKKGEFVGLIIENEDVAQTLRSLFKFIFDYRVQKEQ